MRTIIKKEIIVMTLVISASDYLTKHHTLVGFSGKDVTFLQFALACSRVCTKCPSGDTIHHFLEQAQEGVSTLLAD